VNVQSVLDLPCGHGRVLRHLVKLFPDARFHACDLDYDGVDFCAQTFGAIPVYSKAELSELDFDGRFDLIWVGSLFTHTSQVTTKRWLAHLAKYLDARGIVVATFHGRWAESVHQRSPYIGQERWEKVLGEYRSCGYGHANYVSAETPDHVDESYGVSLAKPHTLIEMVEQIPGVRIFQYAKRAWADHQDVLVFGKPSIDTLWPSAE
jgi:trans-aconitate methyltransferase